MVADVDFSGFDLAWGCAVLEVDWLAGATAGLRKPDTAARANTKPYLRPNRTTLIFDARKPDSRTC